MDHCQLTALERLEQCNSVEDMARAFPEGPIAPFSDPVVARLYDTLLSSDRVSMVRGVVDEYLAAIGTVLPGSRFLDVGCGSGNVLLEMARRLSPKQATFIGVDPSPEMIAIAQNNRKREPCASQVSFLCGAATDTDIVDGIQEVDYLVIRNTISWMADAERELGIWLGRLKPRGAVLIRELRRDAYFPLLKARIRKCLAFHAHEFTLAYPPSAMVAAYRSALTLAELVPILSRCGISITITRPREHDDVTAEPWGVDMFVVGEREHDFAN